MTVPAVGDCRLDVGRRRVGMGPRPLRKLQLAFFTHVSHEFRTPLSVVIGYTEDVGMLVTEINKHDIAW